jgi:opacity protein-like surface antigen
LDVADGEDTVLAWQLGAGLACNAMPGLSVSVDYRWFNAEDAKFKSRLIGQKFESTYSSHSVLAAMRFTF